MFGFSLPKLFVLMAIIALVWYGFKVFGRSHTIEKSKNDLSEGKVDQHVDMEKCSVCEDYVDPGAISCRKEDCPFPTV